MSGWIAGYAARFGTVDRGGDVIAPGAFRATLARAGGRGWPLLDGHRPGRALGWVRAAREDARGLRVVAELADGVALPASRGLSFGYRVVAARRGPDGVRAIAAVELIEVSVVAQPMHPGARVLAVRGEEG